jgi:hypothetical protein
MRAEGRVLVVAEATIIVDTTMVALVPEVDGIRAVIIGEILLAIEMDGELAIVDVARALTLS